MADRFKKVQAGQALEVSANTWNSLIDVASEFHRHQHDRRAESSGENRKADIVKVRNQSGRDLERFAVVALQTPIIEPSENLLEFKQQPTFEIGLPVSDTYTRFAILIDPLQEGAIGRATAAGVSIARVAVVHTVYECAIPVEGQPSYLMSVPHGPATVLWIEPTGSVRWAIIRIDQSNMEQIVLITSNIPDDEGYYSGIVQTYDTSSRTWISQYACKVLDTNR